MNTAWIAFLINVAMHSPELAGQGAKLYADIAHGEGGLGKVHKALTDLTAILGVAAGAAAPPAAPVQPGALGS